MISKLRNCWPLFVLIYLNAGYFKVSEANSVFRFGFDFDFNIINTENSIHASFNVGDEKEEFENSETSTTKEYTTDMGGTYTTVFPPIPINIWSDQNLTKMNATNRLQATFEAVTKLKNEISAVVGHSDFIAAKVKLMTRYLSKVNAVMANKTATAAVDDVGGEADADGDSGVVGHDDAAAKRFLILQDYVQLVDDLRAPPTNAESGERSLDFMVMKLGLEKHKLIELQTQILVEVLQAMEKWQTFVKEQVVEVV